MTRGEDSRYLFMVRDVRDSYDISTWGEVEACYEGIVGRNAARVRFGVLCAEGAFDTEYSVLSHFGSSHNFGCVSMRKKDYCIFNKQYSKEEYHALVEKIKEQMRVVPFEDRAGKKYMYGEFFPPELSPHGYNESLAAHMFPLSEQEAKTRGFGWVKEIRGMYKIDRQSSDLPDHIKDADETILQDVIGCGACGTGFKIIPREFNFLKRRNLPLPRRCPLCRVKEKLDIWMSELKNLHGMCAECGAAVEYPCLHEGERILCKQCYQKELI